MKIKTENAVFAGIVILVLVLVIVAVDVASTS